MASGERQTLAQPQARPQPWFGRRTWTLLGCSAFRTVCSSIVAIRRCAMLTNALDRGWPVVWPSSRIAILPANNERSLQSLVRSPLELSLPHTSGRRLVDNESESEKIGL